MQEETPGQKLGKVLREQRDRYGWKLEYLERRTGLDNSYLSKIERGIRRTVPRETLEKLATGYQLPLSLLEEAMAGAEEIVPPLLRSFADVLEEARMVAPIAIPVIEHPAHAGHGGTEPMDVVYVDRPFGVNRNLVCVPVKGNCMEPKIDDGDRVIVDRDKWPERGQVVLAVVDEDVLVRRFYPTNSHFVLRCDAPGYDDIEATEVNILGVVVEIRKRP